MYIYIYIYLYIYICYNNCGIYIYIYIYKIISVVLNTSLAASEHCNFPRVASIFY